MYGTRSNTRLWLVVSGQECAFGSFDRIRLFSYQPRKGMFDEAPMKEIKNLYTVTAMAWRSGNPRTQCFN
jgi:intraflagellar transport protein 172